MKKISMIISTFVLAMVLASCSAEENHKNTTQTEMPQNSPSATQSVGEDMKDAARNVTDGVGNVTRGAGEMVRDAGNKIKTTVK